MAELNTNAITWFEIPVRNLERATRFYEAMLEAPLKRETMGGEVMALLPHEPGRGVGGCLFAGDGAPAPAANGTLVYLNVAPSLDPVLARAERAGGRVTTPKTALPDGMGFYAHVIDSEGNRVGLHAPA